MIGLYVKNHRVHIDNPSEGVLGLIKFSFSVIDPKSRMIRTEFPPDPVRFYRVKKDPITDEPIGVSLPYGLKKRLTKELTKAGYTFRVDDPPPLPVKFGNAVATATGGKWNLDEIQRETASRLLKTWVGSAELSVGSGKTILMTELAGSFFLAEGRPVAVVVPKKQLLHQVFKELTEFLPGFKIGMIGDGKRIPGDIRVCTAATLSSKKLDHDTALWLSGIGALIFDEVHHGNSPTWKALLKQARKKARVWGVSGKITFTDKLDELRIEALYGPPVIQARNEERLCPVEIIVHGKVSKEWQKVDYPSKLETGVVVHHLPLKSKEWMQLKYIRNGLEGTGAYHKGHLINIKKGDTLYETAEDMGMVLSNPRNRWAIKLAESIVADGGKVVITFSRGIHGKMLSRTLTKRGVVHTIVDGKMSGPNQQATFAALEDGSLKLVVAQYNCMKEGTNVRSLTDIILLNDPVSPQTLEQLKGRVERAIDGKERGRVHIPGDFHNPHLRAKVRRMLAYYKTIKVTIIQQ